MDSSIALRPFHIVATTKFTIEADHEFTEMLRRYQTFYREAYGEKVEEADLIYHMAKQFMEVDKKFQSFGKKRQRRKSTSAKKSSERGNGQTGTTPQLSFNKSS
ncbi:MAG: DUF2274 domain-containing protein [Phycisphaerae bacterium]